MALSRAISRIEHMFEIGSGATGAGETGAGTAVRRESGVCVVDGEALGRLTLGELHSGPTISADAHTIIGARRLLDRFEAALADAERRFAGAEMWRDRGSGSMASWLHDEGGLTLRDARIAAKRCDRLDVWPEVCAGWLGGAITGAKVDLLVAMVPSRFVQRLRNDAEVLVTALGPLDLDQSMKVIRSWISMAEADDSDESWCDRPGGLHLSTTLGGRGILDADLDAEGAALVAAALRVFERPDAPPGEGDLDEPRTPAMRRAEALVDLARFGLAHHESGSDAGRHHPHVSIVVDLPELMAATLRGARVRTASDLARLAETKQLGPVEMTWFTDALARVGESSTFDGAALGALATDVLACDSVVQRVLTAGSRVIDLGRSVRSTPNYLRRAVIVRDRHCRAPGCTRPARWCDVHHVDPWVTGGRTDLDRLVLLCSFHHHQFHKPGWECELGGDGEFTVRAPDRRVRTTSPPGHEPPMFMRKRSSNLLWRGNGGRLPDIFDDAAAWAVVNSAVSDP
jgi:hypothetical protein